MPLFPSFYASQLVCWISLVNCSVYWSSYMFKKNIANQPIQNRTSLYQQLCMHINHLNVCVFKSSSTRDVSAPNIHILFIPNARLPGLRLKGDKVDPESRLKKIGRGDCVYFLLETCDLRFAPRGIHEEYKSSKEYWIAGKSNMKGADFFLLDLEKIQPAIQTSDRRIGKGSILAAIAPRKKKTRTFHYTGCFIGILIMVYSNPHMTGQYNPLYSLNNQGFVFAQLVSFPGISMKVFPCISWKGIKGFVLHRFVGFFGWKGETSPLGHGIFQLPGWQTARELDKHQNMLKIIAKLERKKHIPLTGALPSHGGKQPKTLNVDRKWLITPRIPHEPTNPFSPGQRWLPGPQTPNRKGWPSNHQLSGASC